MLTCTVEVIVTVPPTGMSPVHTAPVAPSVSVPEVAVTSPTAVASSAIPLASVATLTAKYGVCPVLVSVAVYPTWPPGVTVATLAVKLIVSCDTVTGAAHRGSALPDAQLLPGDTELTVLERIMFPVSGLLTVTE